MGFPSWHGSCGAHVGAALLVAAVPRLGLAQPALSLTLYPASAGDAGVLVSAPDARGAGILRARVLLDHAEQPFVLTSPIGRKQAIVDQQTFAHAELSFAIAHRVLVTARLPVALRTRGSDSLDPPIDGPSSKSGAGDVGFGGRVRVLGPPGDGWQLGLSLEGIAPTGTREAYAGEPTFGARSLAIVGARQSEYVFSAQLGVHVRQSRRFDGVLPYRVGSAVEAGALLQLPIDRGRRWWLGPELAVASTISGGAKLLDPRSTSMHLLVNARARPLPVPLEVTAAFGPDLGQAPGSADYRVVVALGWVPDVPVPPPDRDGDTIPDRSDICVGLPGVPSNDPLMHGCPEVPLDTDGDSVPDAFDACPRVPGIATAERKTHGCPPVVQPAPEPPKPAATLVEQRIEISEQVQFETGTATLLPASIPILQAVAQVMLDNPTLELVEVAGHTDDTGTPERNQSLSTERAQSVLDWLADHGVSRSRLVARGYGQSQPLVDNATDSGRATNRRVEFRVLRRTSAPGSSP